MPIRYCTDQGLWSVWDRGDTSPNIWSGDTITGVLPLFEESIEVKLCLFVDFVAFYFTKTHILL